MAEPPEPPSARFEFPSMLYDMLEDCTFGDDKGIIAWEPHGHTFKIYAREEFEEKVLPRYFKEKYESFRCLLEQWGFLRLSRGKNRGCWYQSNFVYGDRSKIHGVTKKDFLVGMPEYLGFRDEPDFMALATMKTRIPAKRKVDVVNTFATDKGDAAFKSNIKIHPKSRGVAPSSMSEEAPLKEKRGKRRKEGINTLFKTKTSPQLFAGLSHGGCSNCGRDDDHPNLLLCEACDSEIHIYCLKPPLDSVPDDDWFCDTCTTRMREDGDNLDALIRKIPAEMLSRFGEIVWAKSAEKAAFFPSMIFDPRSFLANSAVVELAKKNLGKRYLVYFYEASDSFAAIPRAWILKWEEGLKRQYDSGKSVQGASKKRIHQFHRALNAAKTALEDSSVTATSYRTAEPDRYEQSAAKSATHSQRNVEGGSLYQQEGAPSHEGSYTQADSKWVSVRDRAIVEVSDSLHDAPVQIDDEILRGITMRPSGKWQAQLYFAGKSRYIGVFDSREEAALAFNLVRSRLRPPGSEAKSTSSRNPLCVPAGTTSEGAVHSSFSNLFSRQFSPKARSMYGTFNDKRPDRTNYRSGRQIQSQNRDSSSNRGSPQRHEQKKHKRGYDQRSTRHTDHERKLLVSTTPLCQYYLPPLV